MSAQPQSMPRLAREKFRVTLVALVLVGVHGAWVAGTYGNVAPSALWSLGAYVGALGAFIVAVGLGSGWHLTGGHPNARFGHVVVTAWLLSLPAAVLGMLVALGGGFSATPREAALAAAVLAAVPGVLLAARATPRMLERLAQQAPSTPADAPWVLAPAAALASGTFGALHPWVRFPNGPPTVADAAAYTWTGITITATLLPIAGLRISRGLRASGALQATPKSALLPAAWAFTAVGLGVGVLSVQPLTLVQWSIFRAVAGALLGALGILVGSALSPPRGSGRSAWPGRASRPPS